MIPLRPAPLASEAIAFQDEIDALVAEPAPRLLRLWPALVGAMLVGVLVLAGVARVDIVITAQGRLTPDAPPMVLQPMASVVLRELRVQAGDVVHQGDVVAVLDSTFTTADREALEAQRRMLAAQRDRLTAELSGAPVPAAPGPEAALQAQLQAQRAAFHEARRAALDAELVALDKAAAAERANGAGLQHQLDIAREIETMRGRLAEEQVGSKLNLLVSTASRLDVEQDQRRHIARLDELAAQAEVARAERDAFQRDWQRSVMEDLARVQPDLARIEEQLAKADRLDALTRMRAPSDGVVLEVARRSPGSLVREGEPVVVLVPSDVALIAEITLASADIGRLQPGDPAELKIDSFPWRQHGTLTGSLRAISRESYPAPNGGGVALHRGQIVLAGGALRGLAPGAGLVPGMTLTAELKVGSRSVLEFFLDPLLRGLAESLREP